MKHLILIAALAITVPAFAQVQGQNQTTETQSTSAASNQGVKLSLTQEAAKPNKESFVFAAPATYAPGLTAGFGTCMGSESGSFSFVLGGGAKGETVLDESCDGREWFKLYMANGLPQVAFQRICQLPREREALEAAGHTCPPMRERDEDRRRTASQGQYPDNIRGN